jgi:hypothetical protein
VLVGQHTQNYAADRHAFQQLIASPPPSTCGAAGGHLVILIAAKNFSFAVTEGSFILLRMTEVGYQLQPASHMLCCHVAAQFVIDERKFGQER